MSGSWRFVGPFTIAVAAVIFAPITPVHLATADPDIDTESAAEVIEELKEQGYEVQVKGVSGDQTAMLTACKVSSINDSGVATPDPTTTTLVYVEVACPIQKS